jgi:outer membrane immunogenic protein
MSLLLNPRVVFFASCLLALTAAAARSQGLPDGKDLKQVAPGPEATCDFSWTGLYVGARLGGGFSDSDFRAHGEPVGRFTINPEHQDLNADGFIGGGELGFNWQICRLFVIGAEFDFSGSDMSDDTTASHFVPQIFVGGANVPLHASQDINWFGTLRGRVGFVPWCKFLIYGTTGFAFAGVDDSVDFDLRPFGGGASYPASHSDTETGWTAGAGFEYALSQHWTIKVEYLYFDVGDQTAIGHPIPANPPFQVRYDWEAQFHTVTGGINFKF